MTNKSRTFFPEHFNSFIFFLLFKKIVFFLFILFVEIKKQQFEQNIYNIILYSSVVTNAWKTRMKKPRWIH